MSVLSHKSDQELLVQNTWLVFCVFHTSKNIYISLEEKCMTVEFM